MMISNYKRIKREENMIKLAKGILLLVILLLIDGDGIWAQTPEEISGGDGLKLAVYEGGNPDGPAILFIHGYTANYLAWKEQFSGILADKFRLIAFDLRGHGASEKPLQADEYRDPELWADDINAVIRAKELDNVTLVCWSYGGYIVADYLRMYGEENVSGLVFVGAFTKQETADGQSFFDDQLPELLQGMVSSEVQTNIHSTRSFVSNWTAEPLERDFFEILLSGSMMVPPEVRLALSSRGLNNDDILEETRVPTLVIHGDEDRIIKLASSKHTAEMIADAELKIYEGIGHAPPIEDSEKFDLDIAEFMDVLPEER